MTTILDPAQAPAAELAALYAKRWQLETTLDELKTHQCGAGLVLRSKTPDGVHQELYGHLLVHYAIRALMHDAAQQVPHPTRAGLVHPLAEGWCAAKSPVRRRFPPELLARPPQ